MYKSVAVLVSLALCQYTPAEVTEHYVLLWEHVQEVIRTSSKALKVF